MGALDIVSAGPARVADTGIRLGVDAEAGQAGPREGESRGGAQEAFSGADQAGGARSAGARSASECLAEMAGG